MHNCNMLAPSKSSHMPHSLVCPICSKLLNKEYICICREIRPEWCEWCWPWVSWKDESHNVAGSLAVSNRAGRGEGGRYQGHKLQVAALRLFTYHSSIVCVKFVNCKLCICYSEAWLLFTCLCLPMHNINGFSAKLLKAHFQCTWLNEYINKCFSCDWHRISQSDCLPAVLSV